MIELIRKYFRFKIFILSYTNFKTRKNPLVAGVGSGYYQAGNS